MKREICYNASCQLDVVNNVINPLGKDRVSENSKKGLRCDIFKGFRFEFTNLDMDIKETRLEIKWPNRKEETSIFDRNFKHIHFS